MRVILLLVGSFFSSQVWAATDFSDYVERMAERRAQLAAENADLREALSKITVFNVDETEVDENLLYTAIDDTAPAVNVISSVYMGDTMVRQREGYYAECLTPARPLFEPHMGQEFWATATPVCKVSGEEEYYQPMYVNFRGGDKERSLPVSIKEKDDGIQFCWGSGFLKKCTDKMPVDAVMETYGFVRVNDSFQRQIEYAGKSGSVVNFIYSEFEDDFARASFTRDFQVDLNDGLTAAYKGLIFEVLDVDNASITYRIIRHFPD